MTSQTFLIFGVPNGGVFMARQLRKQWPTAIIYAIGFTSDIGRYSSVIDSFTLVSNTEEIRKAAFDIHHNNPKGRTIKAYICSNPMLEEIVQHFSEFFDMFEFENDFQTYATIVNKKDVEKLCKELQISIPQEYSVGDMDCIDYPIAVKPLLKKQAIGAQKCQIVESKQDLQQYLQFLAMKGVAPESLNYQKFVRGDNRWEYGYGGYFRDGEPLVDVTFHQFRQNPQGLCCYIRELANPELEIRIKQLVMPLLKHLRINGFIEFDIKEDEVSHQLYVLDVNPRPWRSSDMLTVKLGTSTIFSPQDTGVKVVWRYPYRDFMSYLSRNKNNVSCSDCKRLAQLSPTLEYCALSDPSDKRPQLETAKMDCKSFIQLFVNKLKIIFKR